MPKTSGAVETATKMQRKYPRWNAKSAALLQSETEMRLGALRTPAPNNSYSATQGTCQYSHGKPRGTQLHLGSRPSAGLPLSLP